VTTVPNLTVRPVVHSAQLSEWLAIFEALGARTLSTDPLWTEVEFDQGRLTLSDLVHGATEGSVVLGFETGDLAAYAEAVHPPVGMTVEKYATEQYESLRIVSRDGFDFLIDQRLPGGREFAVPTPVSRVQVVWNSPAAGIAKEDLEALGLRQHVQDGPAHLFDMRAAEGSVTVQSLDHGRPFATVAIGVSDLDRARRALGDVGIPLSTRVDVDRVLRVPTPGDNHSHLLVTAMGAGSSVLGAGASGSHG
jgi:hypothetical protein